MDKYLVEIHHVPRFLGVMYKNGERIADSAGHHYSSMDSLDHWIDSVKRAHRPKGSSYSYNIEVKHVWLEGQEPKAEDFQLNVNKHNWDCGDGCCSDSGYEGTLEYKGHTVRSWDDWGHTRDADTIISNAVGHIKTAYGITLSAEDIPTRRTASEEGHYDYDKNEYVEGNTWEDY